MSGTLGYKTFEKAFPQAEEKFTDRHPAQAVAGPQRSFPHDGSGREHIFPQADLERQPDAPATASEKSPDRFPWYQQSGRNYYKLLIIPVMKSSLLSKEV